MFETMRQPEPRSRWKRWIERIAHVQYLALVAILYFLLIWPYTLWLRWRRRRYRRPTYWQPKILPDYTVENYRAQSALRG